MLAAVLHILAGLTGGMAAALQAALASRIGLMASVFVIHVGGTLLSAVLLVSRGGEELAAWRNGPWYALGAGTLGVVLLSCLNYAIPRLGVGTTITLFVTAQLILGALLDHYGLLGSIPRPLDLSRAFGVATLLLGTWLIVR
jgi:transporter family-2 protein